MKNGQHAQFLDKYTAMSHVRGIDNYMHTPGYKTYESFTTVTSPNISEDL